MKPTDRDLQIKAETLTCKHFNGVHRDNCRAGVNYRALVGEPEFGCMTRIPCISVFGFEPKGGPLAVCDRRELPTREEAEAHVEKSEAAIDRHMRAHRAAHDDAKAKGFKRNNGGGSSCVCPICAGTLNYRVASYNGHIHAACETKGCVQWLE